MPFNADEDLRGKELRGARLGRHDLRGRDLSGADLSLADLRLARLDKARLAGATLTGARLRRATLTGADLSGANLSGADLDGADLSGAKLFEANLDGALLEGARLEAADLGKAQLARLALQRARLRQATLGGADLSGAQLTDADLRNTDLSEARLDEADLSFADLEGAILTGASLRRANLSGANLARADLRETEVEGARLSWALGLTPQRRRELQQRGARVPLSRLADPWARFNALARRQPGLLYVITLLLVAAGAGGMALWVGSRMAGERVYQLSAPSEGVVYQVDCGTAEDRPFRGQAGHLGGKPGREPRPADAVRQPSAAPPRAYLTDRHGDEFGYRFRVGAGWYEVQLHFIELTRRKRGARTFDIRIEDRVVARNFDILSETYYGTTLTRSWAVRVDDGFLDLQFKRRRGQAKVSFIRVRHLDRATGQGAPR